MEKKLSKKNDKEALIKRLRRIEGQVKGIQKMIENDKYCVDILIQIAAIRSAIDKVGGIMLKNHVNTCVKSSLENECETKKDEIIEELINTMLKFMK